MAGREKKPALVKKQMLSSPIPPKEAEITADVPAAKATPVKGDAEPAVPAAASASPAKPIRKTKPKKPIKKNLKINFKAKAKTNKKLKLTKSIFKASKLDKTLIKNGIKAKRKTNIRKPANVQKTEDLPPPVLEPQVPIPEQNIPVKKEVKKRVKKVANPEDASGSETSEKKMKPADKGDKSHEETVEDILNEVASELEIDIDYLMKKTKKIVRKPKAEKAEASAAKSDEVKPKRGTPKKLKPETPKFKKTIKKENLIEPFCSEITLDSEAQNVINSLDLNVTKTARKKAVKKRRHSIEKIPAVDEVQNDTNFEPPFVLFPNTRRSASPRSKRNAKIRKSIDTPTNKRLNPYTTRSDSPARILRNGKHRRLRGSQLLEGLDSEYKKRRRLCSEYSGSEISKYSGYLSESDSSFSDLASLQENGANDLDSPRDDNITKSDLLKKEILDSIKSPEPNDLQNLNIKQISNKFTAILKRSLSTETNPLPDSLLNEDIKPKLEDIGVNNFTDTNSNDLKVQVKTETEPGTEEDVKTEKVKCERPQIKIEKMEEEDGKINEKIASSPSEKLPEKSLILDSMKLTFNDVEEVEKRATRSSKRQIKLEEEKDKLATVTTTKFYGPDQNENEEETDELENNDETTVEEEEIEDGPPELTAEAPPPLTVDTIGEAIELVVNHEDYVEPVKESEEIPVEKDMSIEYNNVDKEIDELLNDSYENENENETEMNHTDNKQSIEDELLTKLQGNSSISIVRNDSPVRKEESPMLVDIGLNGDDVHLENKENNVENINPIEPMQVIEETPENLAIKENILSALGLQSLRAAEEAKQRDKQKIQNKPETYTGTLKTVIKLNRQSDKKKRNPLKMTLQKSKSRSLKDADGNKSDGANSKSDGEGSCYKVMKETGSSSGWKHGSHSSDTAGANRKSHYFNRSNMDVSSEHASDGDMPSQDGESSGTKALVIPEKASSFGIHPDRLCSDECAYCFGKFGLFDTPLHIAQIKSEERQKKILQNEIYLTRDSCLCDACYRHVDRRVNTNSNAPNLGNNKNLKRNVLSNLPRQNNCHVLGCDMEASHVLRRKWLIKMRKSVLKVINIDLDNPGLHSIPICSEHYEAVEHLMVCALCKRRLARNHIHYLSFELETLNNALDKEGIPVKLTDKPVVCKLCRYFATLLVKDSNDIKSNTANFFKQYKKRLLHFHDIELMDETEAEEPIAVPLKEKNEKEATTSTAATTTTTTTSTTSIKRGKNKNKSSRNSKGNTGSPEMLSNSEQLQMQLHHPENDKTDQSRVPSNSENGESRESSSPPSDSVDIETLVPNMILECASDTEDTSKSEVPQQHQHHLHHQHQQQQKTLYKKLQIPDSVREAVEISKIMKMNNGSNNNSNSSNSRQKKSNVVERLGSNPSISVRQLFPGEEDLPLQGSIDFNSAKERTPEGWEKCSCTIQYDVDTKHLWQELQKPYGNQSSFLRHLILLEKYFRNGDLTLSPNASHHAVNYSVSVQNRLRAYDNIPTNSLPMQPLTMLPFNQVKKSQSGIITTNNIVNAANLPKSTPIPISSINPNFLTQLSVRHKSPGVPPGLISLQPGTNRPVAPLVKMSQRFKLPVGTKWRPTLIPVNPKGAPVNASGDKRITGLVQVISGGKPYHISLADYNRMCCLKKSHEMKQQKGAEAKLKQREPEVSASSVLKPVIPRKPKVATVTSSAISAASPSGIVNKAVTVTAIPKENTSTTASTSEMKNGSGGDSNRLSSPQEMKGTSSKSLMILPKIPKSLTVIPQTVPRKPLQPSSPTLSITTKPSTSKS